MYDFQSPMNSRDVPVSRMLIIAAWDSSWSQFVAFSLSCQETGRSLLGLRAEMGCEGFS